HSTRKRNSSAFSGVKTWHWVRRVLKKPQRKCRERKGCEERMSSVAWLGKRNNLSSQENVTLPCQLLLHPLPPTQPPTASLFPLTS
ncbi:hypothetical protein KUCAC02_006682, partial [Chaenocephalus aceratus]